MHRVAGWKLLVIIGGLGLCAAVGWAVWRQRNAPSAPEQELATAAGQMTAKDVERLRPAVTAFCGDCHATPPPESFPRAAWYDEVKRGFEFYYTSGRSDLALPVVTEVTAFYQHLAPENLVLPAPPAASGPAPAAFKPQPLDRTGDDTAPGAAFVKWMPLESESPGLLLCDMRSGQVRWAASLTGETEFKTLARLNHPCHAELADLDGNGVNELIISDLGSFLPEDHDRGRVVWLRRDEMGAWETEVLADGLGRVADARAADFDGDGDQDVIVAEFGWHKTGGIHLLENRDGEFHRTRIDPRAGAIHLPVCDLNDDGRPDFLALISQHYETIVAFVNDGTGKFNSQTLWEAGDPGFGFSGLEMVDFDGDGDLDLLYTNGDTFDSSYLKPSHGIHWLENRGQMAFLHRRLADLPGVYRALPGDMDGDGDMDLVAGTFLPQFVTNAVDPGELDSLVLLEQATPGKFEYHRLERGKPEHATLDLADCDGDGDLDIITGVQVGTGGQSRPRAVVWWNQSTP